MFFDVLILVGAMVLTPTVVVIVTVISYVFCLKMRGFSKVENKDVLMGNKVMRVTSFVATVFWIAVPFITAGVGMDGRYYSPQWYVGCTLISSVVMILVPPAFCYGVRVHYMEGSIIGAIAFIFIIGLACIVLN